MGIDNILLYDETIFKDINVFDPDYVPEIFNYRDSQLQELAICIRPAMKGGRPMNSVILGLPASGKTTAVLKIFEKIDDITDKIVCCHINCQLNTTAFGILSQIHKKVLGYKPPYTGSPFAAVYKKIMEKLSNEGKSLIVALDDSNLIFNNNIADKIFYDILRAHEEYPGVQTSIFVILPDIEFRYFLDKSVQSVFIPKEISFNPYTYDEIYNILKERVRLGFYQGVIDDELIEDITTKTHDQGDLRVGINLLKVSGTIAEAEASRKITKEHVDKAIDEAQLNKLRSLINELGKNELKLMELIMESTSPKLTTGTLFEEFSEETGLSYATFKRTIDKLEFMKILDTKYLGKGQRGQKRSINLRFHKKDIRRCLSKK